MAVLVAVSGCTSEQPEDAPPGTPDSSTSASASRTPTREETREEQGQAQARCLQALGWDAVFDEGGVTATYPTDQQESYEADVQSCEQQTGFGSAPVPYTPAEIEAMYDAMLEVRTCLVEAELPVSEPPSRESYEAGIAAGVPVWHPYDAAFAAGEVQQVETACPVPEQWR